MSFGFVRFMVLYTLILHLGYTLTFLDPKIQIYIF